MGNNISDLARYSIFDVFFAKLLLFCNTIELLFEFFILKSDKFYYIF